MVLEGPLGEGPRAALLSLVDAVRLVVPEVTGLGPSPAGPLEGLLPIFETRSSCRNMRYSRRDRGQGRFGLLSRRRENRESEPIKISASDHQPQKAAGQNTRQVGTDKQGRSVSQGRECGETKEMNSLSRINRVHMWQETRRVGGESAGVGSNWSLEMMSIIS